jgi:hypothetical protein
MPGQGAFAWTDLHDQLPKALTALTLSPHTHTQLPLPLPLLPRSLSPPSPPLPLPSLSLSWSIAVRHVSLRVFAVLVIGRPRCRRVERRVAQRPELQGLPINNSYHSPNLTFLCNLLASSRPALPHIPHPVNHPESFVHRPAQHIR